MLKRKPWNNIIDNSKVNNCDYIKCKSTSIDDKLQN